MADLKIVITGDIQDFLRIDNFVSSTRRQLDRLASRYKVQVQTNYTEGDESLQFEPPDDLE